MTPTRCDIPLAAFQQADRAYELHLQKKTSNDMQTVVLLGKHYVIFRFEQVNDLLELAVKGARSKP